jgi:DNA-binding MarR family transcriptional regulator
MRDSVALTSAGDRLVVGLGLTSARGQILGSIVAAERPEPVAWLARKIGANRQSVQRIVNDLEEQGLVSFETNPHHRRAQLVVLTDEHSVPARGIFHLPLKPPLSAHALPFFPCTSESGAN